MPVCFLISVRLNWYSSKHFTITEDSGFLLFSFFFFFHATNNLKKKKKILFGLVIIINQSIQKVFVCFEEFKKEN